MSQPAPEGPSGSAPVYRHIKLLGEGGMAQVFLAHKLAPGGGWYTEILGPLLNADGQLTVSIDDPAGPEAYYGTRNANAMLERQKA